MVNKRLPYERDPIPQDKEPLRFEPESIGSKIFFGFSMVLAAFFSDTCFDRYMEIL